MIDYTLVKELKDNGFPHNDWTVTSLDSFPPIVYFNNPPTLSELIEACGDGIHSIRKGIWKGNGNWMASQDSLDSAGNSYPVEPVGTGDTPEEAVAKLWLAINKK